MSGDGIPSILQWGLNGKADEFWNANDFEILGDCYQCEVEDFLAFLSNHHDFPSVRKEVKTKLRTTSDVILAELLGESSPSSPTTPTVAVPVFAPGEADSILRFQCLSTLSYTY